jgi:hypothetical protein
MSKRLGTLESFAANRINGDAMRIIRERAGNDVLLEVLYLLKKPIDSVLVDIVKNAVKRKIEEQENIHNYTFWIEKWKPREKLIYFNNNN